MPVRQREEVQGLLSVTEKIKAKVSAMMPICMPQPFIVFPFYIPILGIFPILGY
jgi:hypothetical protein